MSGLDGGEGEVASVVGGAVVEEAKAAPAQTVKPDDAGNTGDPGLIGATTDPSSAESQKNAAKEAASAVAKPNAELPKKELEVLEYELEVEEDSPLSDEDLAAIAKEAETLKLPKEKAMELVKSREALVKKGYNSYEAKAIAIDESNKKNLLAMPEFAPEAREQTIQTLKKVVDTFGDAELLDFLKGPAGNHPSVAKLLLSIGKSMESDTFKGKGATQNSTSTSDPLKSMYPDFYEKE